MNTKTDENMKKGSLLSEGIIDISEFALSRDVAAIIEKRKEFESLSENVKNRKRRANFYAIMKDYREILELNPYLPTQYKEETLIFKKDIIDFEHTPRLVFPPSFRVMKAAMEVSHYRVREKRQNGWVCGTYMARVEARFESRIRRTFSQEELAELIETIEGGNEFTSRQRDIITALLHIAPEVHVHKFMTDLYDF